MALYNLTEEQVKLLLELINETPFKGMASEKITELKKALRSPNIRHEQV